MAVGTYSILTKKWHFRSGNLASENEAYFFGCFILLVGVFVLIMLLVDKNKTE
jgi:hypothetical protein